MANGRNKGMGHNRLSLQIGVNKREKRLKSENVQCVKQKHKTKTFFFLQFDFTQNWNDFSSKGTTEVIIVNFHKCWLCKHFIFPN